MPGSTAAPGEHFGPYGPTSGRRPAPGEHYSPAPGVYPNAPGAEAARAAAFIARQTIDKLTREATNAGIQFGTVISVASGDGLTPLVTLHPDGADDDITLQVPSIQGDRFVAGSRVAIQWDNPHGAYVIGSTDPSPVPYGRITQFCSTGNPSIVPASGEAQIELCCEEFIAGGMIDQLGANSFFEAPVDGLYLLNARGIINQGNANNDLVMLTNRTLENVHLDLNTADPGEQMIWVQPAPGSGSDFWTYDDEVGDPIAQFTGRARFTVALELTNGTGSPSADEVSITIHKNDSDVLRGYGAARFDTALGLSFINFTAFDDNVSIGDTYSISGQADAPIVNTVTIANAIGDGMSPHTFFAAVRTDEGLQNNVIDIQLRVQDGTVSDVFVPLGAQWALPIIYPMRAGWRATIVGSSSLAFDVEVGGVEFEICYLGPYVDPTPCSSLPPE